MAKTTSEQNRKAHRTKQLRSKEEQQYCANNGLFYVDQYRDGVITNEGRYTGTTTSYEPHIYDTRKMSSR